MWQKGVSSRQNGLQSVVKLQLVMVQLSEFRSYAFTILQKLRAIFLYDCSHIH